MKNRIPTPAMKLLAACFALCCSAQADTFTVTNTDPSGAGSLSQAVADAAALAGADTILFDPNLSGQTITLTGGEISLNSALTLDGSALSGGVTIAGNGTGRLLNIVASGDVTLVGLTLTGGNVGGGAGGAIHSAGGSSLRIVGCTFSGNHANEGGAILNGGSLLVENSTFSGNTGGFGGALQCRNLTTLIHCTFSGNNGYYGGAIYNNATTLTVNNSIIAGNTAGGGIRDILNQSAALVFTNANLVQSVTPSTAAEPITGPAPLTDDPLLAVLGNYGGPTPTRPPLAGSPAIDAGGGSPLTSDQRGHPRVIGPAADLGAMEFVLTTSVVSTSADSGAGSLRFAVEHASPSAANTVTFDPSLSGGTILLTSGQLHLKASVTVDAAALASPVRINADHASRLMQIESNAVVVLNSLVLSNGRVAGTNGADGSRNVPLDVGSPGGDGTAAFGGGIYNAGHLTLNQTTLSGCVAQGGNGGEGFFAKAGASAPGKGGGIYSVGTLTLNQSTLSNNAASGGAGGAGIEAFGRVGSPGLGGGIYQTGSLTMNDSMILDGSANGGAGGEAYHRPGANAGVGQGGGIFNAGTLSLNRSTIAGASANGGEGGFGRGSPSAYDESERAGGQGAGGAIYNTGSLTANQSTVANSSARGGRGGGDPENDDPGAGGDGLGGAIFNAASLVFNQSTLAGNTATEGLAGFFRAGYSADGISQAGGICNTTTASLFNSIVAGNSALSDSNLFGTFTQTGTNLTTGDPLLSPLANYGGPTPILRPLSGSPAIDAGSDTATGAPYHFATDQRGLPRRSGQAVDIGAAELVIGQPSITAVHASTIGTHPATGTLSVQLLVTVNPNGEAATTVFFQHGLTADYAVTIGPLLVPQMTAPYAQMNLSTTVELSSGYTHHWMARAENSSFTASTPDQTFHLTPPGLPGDTDGDGVVSQAEFAAVRAALGTDELATQNAVGYYTEAQVQSLNVGTPLISQVSPGRFRLTLGVQKSTNLTNPFTDFSLTGPGTTTEFTDGKLKFEFPATDNAAFFRIEAE